MQEQVSSNLLVRNMSPAYYWQLIGLMVMPRTPISSEGEEDSEGDATEESEGVDASLLPPG